MLLGKIVKSASQVRYQARVYQRGQVDCPPSPGDYALGSFVRIALSATGADLVPLLGLPADAARHWVSPTAYAVGVISDTELLAREADGAGLHLSKELQREILTPDFLEQQAVLVWIQLIGTMVVQQAAGEAEAGEVLYICHGVPLLAAQPRSEVARMSDEEVRLFHLQRGTGSGAPRCDRAPYLGYYWLFAAPGNALRQQLRLVILDYLERLFPAHAALLRILKRKPLGGAW